MPEAVARAVFADTENVGLPFEPAILKDDEAGLLLPVIPPFDGWQAL